MPIGFNYQAVAWNGTGDILVNTIIGVASKLHQTSIWVVVIYKETHSPTTTG